MAGQARRAHARREMAPFPVCSPTGRRASSLLGCLLSLGAAALLACACSGAPGSATPPPNPVDPATTGSGEPIHGTPAAKVGEPAGSDSSSTTVVFDQRPVDPSIADENAKPGTTSWRRRKTAADGPDGQISGYALVESVTPGEPVPIAVHVAGGSTFAWTAYRMGWYGGAGAREVAHGGPIAGAAQPACPPQTGSGLVECRWTRSFAVQTGAAWLSGVYLVKLVRADGFERYVPFFVRPSRGAEVRMIVPTATWQAYNRWGGTSLYDDLAGATAPRRHATQVSYDRPYLRDAGAGHLLREGDLSVLTWLEAQGLDVEYLTSEDVDRDPAAFDGAKAIVLSGHDEYWSGAIRDRVDAAVSRGVSLLNLGANQAYWQVRHAPSSDGRDHRIVVGFKEYAFPDPKTGWAGDPVGKDSPRLTTKFRYAPVDRPENALLGVMYGGLYNDFAFPAVVTAPDHWVYAGTGFTRGDTIPFANGYESDDVVDDGNTPANLEILAASPGLIKVGGLGRGSTVIRRQGDAIVFSGGGCGFASVLADPNRADPRAQRMVANVLFRMLRRPVPAALVPFPGHPAPVPDGSTARVTTVATGLGTPVAIALYPDQRTFAVADTNGGRVLRVSPGGAPVVLASGLAFPSGVAVDHAGNVYVADTRNSAVRRIDAATGTLSTLAGSYAYPFALAMSGGGLLVADGGTNVISRVDLATAAASIVATGLYVPTGIAVAGDGTIYVADSGNRRIARIVNGVAETVIGGSEAFRDGSGAAAAILPMYGIAALADGSVVASDPGNYRIRRIVGTTVKTLAGSGRSGSRDGTGLAADLALPSGMALGADGTIYVADPGNGSIRAIQIG